MGTRVCMEAPFDSDLEGLCFWAIQEATAFVIASEVHLARPSVFFPHFLLFSLLRQGGRSPLLPPRRGQRLGLRQGEAGVAQASPTGRRQPIVSEWATWRKVLSCQIGSRVTSKP